jgi:hypothetical protein
MRGRRSILTPAESRGEERLLGMAEVSSETSFVLKQLKLEMKLISAFFGDFSGLLRKSSVFLFGLFRCRSETPKQTEKKKFGFVKQTEKQPKQIEFRFVSV